MVKETHGDSAISLLSKMPEFLSVGEKKEKRKNAQRGSGKATGRTGYVAPGDLGYGAENTLSEKMVMMQILQSGY